MKKNTCIVAATLRANTVAQEDGVKVNALDAKVGSRVKAGLNISHLSGDIENITARTSFHSGILTEMKFSEIFALQPELLFSAQGAKLEEKETGKIIPPQ